MHCLHDTKVAHHSSVACQLQLPPSKGSGGMSGKKEEDHQTKHAERELCWGRVHDAADEISALPWTKWAKGPLRQAPGLYLYLAPLAANGWPREKFQDLSRSLAVLSFSPRQTPCQPRPLSSSRPCNALSQRPASCATKRGALFQSRPGLLPQSVLVPARTDYGREADGAAGPFISRCCRVRNAATTAAGRAARAAAAGTLER